MNYHYLACITGAKINYHLTIGCKLFNHLTAMVVVMGRSVQGMARVVSSYFRDVQDK